MKTLVKMQFGSHVYGTNVPTSEHYHVYGYLYITTNNVNGRQYIGMKKIRSLRGQIDGYYLGSGKAMREALRKYGKQAFTREIIYLSFSEGDLSDAEKEVIAAFGAVNDPAFYNMAQGGKGVILRGKAHPRYGKPMPKGHRESLASSRRFKGHNHTEEAKRRISTKNSGEANYFFGKKHSDETKLLLAKKASERLKLNGHPMQGKKQSAGSIARNIASQPSVIPLEYKDCVYLSKNDMRRTLGFSNSKIDRMIRDGLIKIRKGKLPYKQVAELLESGLKRLKECSPLSSLPKVPD